MKHRDDEWLKQQVLIDLSELADEQERMLMEAEELQDIHMPEERLADIHRELDRRRQEEREKAARRPKIRVAMVLAAALVAALGAGFVGSGEKLYLTKIFQGGRGDETTTKVENSDSVHSEYDEEKVCQEIQEELGMIPVRLGYRPEDLELVKYIIKSEEAEAMMIYGYDDKCFQTYVSKDISDSSISVQVDGKLVDTIMMLSLGMEVSVYEYEDPYRNKYYGAFFEYLNTYYSVCGMMSQEEYERILENIFIENV